MPYCVDVNATSLLFSVSRSPQLVRPQTLGVEQLGARMLFVGMPQAGEPAGDSVGMKKVNMIHDEGGGAGCYEDGQVDDLESM